MAVWRLIAKQYVDRLTFMQISLVDQTRNRLVKFHGRYPEIGRTANLSYSWLTKFAQGRALNPTMRNLEPLIAALTTLENSASAPMEEAEAEATPSID